MSYKKTTQDITITVQPTAIVEASEPDRKKFVFAYDIDIQNNSKHSLALLERYWMVESNGIPVTEVVGPGVIGQLPVIKAGDSFNYQSSAVIEDPVGSMKGKYTFRRGDGKYITADVPDFDLLYNPMLH